MWFDIIVKRMLTDSQIILQRKDREQTKRLKEIWVENGIICQEWNDETKAILSDLRS